MHLLANPETNELRLIDADNFRQLELQVHGRGDLAGAMQGVGTLASDLQHAWIEVEALRRMGRPHDGNWNIQFDQMIAYARSKQWMDPSGNAVRVHILYPDDHATTMKRL